MPRSKLEMSTKYYTPAQVGKELGLSRYQVIFRIKRNVLPEPTLIEAGTRYFDTAWIKEAQKMLEKR